MQPLPIQIITFQFHFPNSWYPLYVSALPSTYVVAQSAVQVVLNKTVTLAAASSYSFNLSFSKQTSACVYNTPTNNLSIILGVAIPFGIVGIISVVVIIAFIIYVWFLYGFSCYYMKECRECSCCY
jgi:hypothetical protein